MSPWKTLLALPLLLTAWSLPARGQGPAAARVAVLVGANGAAPGRQPLLYSHRDVERMADVLRTVGGFSPSNVFVLKDPTPKGLESAMLAAVARLAGQTESMLYFYYSGHADEQSLYPGGRAASLAALRGLIDKADVAVKIGVIDACRGGSWTRAKGLVPDEPFAVRWPVNLGAEGSVLIASSSGLESAHESDRLQGSFFTYHFTAGLRGAADRNGNGDVTLTEAFEYAKERTIRDTLRVAQETQHPSYAVNLRGRRDLVLAQVAASPSTLSVTQEEGPLELIHAESGLALLELPAGPRKVKLAVPPGAYLIRKRLPKGNLIKEIVVAPGGRNEIAEEQLTLVGHVGLAAKSPMSAPRSPPLQLAATAPPIDAAAEGRVWWKFGALLATGVAVVSFGLSLKFAGDVKDVNHDLDPYRRYFCASDGTIACIDRAGTQRGAPLTSAEQDYVNNLQDEGKRFENLQYTTLGVTAVSLLASLPCYYFWSRADEPRALSLSPLVAPGMGGLSAGLRF